jgi:hypothetical protein
MYSIDTLNKFSVSECRNKFAVASDANQSITKAPSLGGALAAGAMHRGACEFHLTQAQQAIADSAESKVIALPQVADFWRQPRGQWRSDNEEEPAARSP